MHRDLHVGDGWRENAWRFVRGIFVHGGFCMVGEKIFKNSS